jgi:hypothetical protein
MMKATISIVLAIWMVLVMAAIYRAQAQGFDLGKFFSVGDMMQCGNIKVFKAPDGTMQMSIDNVDTNGKRAIFPIELKNDQIFMDGKPCVFHSKCERSASC